MVLVFMDNADIYAGADIYVLWWYLRTMLVFTLHAGIYPVWWYLRSMVVFTQLVLSIAGIAGYCIDVDIVSIFA